MPSPTMHNLAEQLTRGCTTDRDKAVRIHDHVRSLPFGFTPYFDAAPPAVTNQLGGHCNPKGALFVHLLRLAGAQLELGC
jgi:hypothetical protein